MVRRVGTYAPLGEALALKRGIWRLTPMDLRNLGPRPSPCSAAARANLKACKPRSRGLWMQRSQRFQIKRTFSKRSQSTAEQCRQTIEYYDEKDPMPEEVQIAVADA